VAKIRNITPDTLNLFRADAPPIFPGDEITVPDDVFVGLAWPTETWEVTEPPALDGVVDVSVDDAAVYEPAPEPEPDLAAMTKADLTAYANDAGVDLGDATTKAEIIAALTSTEA